LRQTEAGVVLRRMGAFTIGKCLAIRCTDLGKQLRALRKDPAYERLVSNRKRVADVIETGRQTVTLRAIKIPSTAEYEGRQFDDLPGIHFAPGVLTIECSGREELLRKLYALAKAIAADPDRFMADGIMGLSHTAKTAKTAKPL
jgi:hypothetical protein